MDVELKIQQWLLHTDVETCNAIIALRNNQKELEKAFAQELYFGTGGVRAKIAVGSSYINVYTIKFLTYSIASYLQQVKLGQVIIGYDTRAYGKLFATTTAEIFTAFGFDVLLLDVYATVGLISFSIRHYQAVGGVLITASHNPIEYSGYKFFNSLGAQPSLVQEQAIYAQQQKLNSNFQTIFNLKPLIQHITTDSTIVKQYCQAIYRPLIAPLQWIYTPLHGSGSFLLPQALAAWGFKPLMILQQTPLSQIDHADVNPEHSTALQEGMIQLQQRQADVLIATDPDVDRLGVAVSHQGNSYVFNGHQIAVLLLHHILKHTDYSSNHVCIKTIVTTPMIERLCAHAQIRCVETLPGFKHIAACIHNLEQQGCCFLFGCEDSHGYLYGQHAYDKDAIVAAGLLLELAASLKKESKSLVDQLYELYQQYGIFYEKVMYVSMCSMKHIREKLRFLNIPYVTIEDFLDSTITFCHPQESKAMTLPTTDAIRIVLEDQTRIVVRPSGTEEKMKLYVSCQKEYDSSEELKIQLETMNQCCERYLHDFYNFFT